MDRIWLYRGVPEESLEAADVEFCGEIRPPRLDRIGVRWREYHSAGETETGYTSWTTDRSIAEAAAGACLGDEKLSGRIRIFRVRIATLDQNRLFEGRADEEEYLIEGIVEGVEFSNEAVENEDD